MANGALLVSTTRLIYGRFHLAQHLACGTY